ncbi:MAG: hypothetical protein ACTSVZ_01960 [Promethearchaeota archaeon]
MASNDTDFSGSSDLHPKDPEKLKIRPIFFFLDIYDFPTTRFKTQDMGNFSNLAQ